MTTQNVILAGVILYLVVMLVVGLLASRRANDAANFIVAGRRMPLYLCAATVMATWFGGGTMMGAAAESYQGGLLAVIADPFGASLALILVGFLFARIFRRLKVFTTVDYMEQRFGGGAATVLTIGTLVSNIGWTGGLLVAFGFVFQTLTGIPVEVGIYSGAAIVLIYTTLGGMWAVAITDFVQMTIIIIGLVVLLVVVLIDHGGWSQLAPQFPEHSLRLIPVEHTATRWLEYFRMWFIFGVADLASQTLMQRASAARNEQVAQNAFYLAGSGYLVIGLVVAVLGIIGSVTLPGLDDPEAVIPMLAMEHLHPVAIAFFVGALLAAIMSSADSSLLAMASIVGENIYPRLRGGASDRQKLICSRIAIPVCGGLALFVALEVQTIYQLMLDANSLLLVSVVVPFVAGIWWKRANRTGVLWAMAVGFVVWMASLWLVPEWPGDLIGMLACAMTLFIVVPLTQRSDPPIPLRDGEGQPVEPRDRLGTLSMIRRLP